jgi:2,4'-dihydroxyacetophenone dioxygenase
MPKAALTEFWKDLKPLEKVFQLDALPEMYTHDVANGDERLFVPFNDTVFSKPLWISPGSNRWCDVLMAKGAGLVNRHYHPHEVFALTISGKWGYLEHDWVATAGDFIYETPGEAHTLVAYEHPDPMQGVLRGEGPAHLAG